MRGQSTAVRRGGFLTLLAVLLAALAACTGLPVSGPVQAGLRPGAVAPPDFTFTPQKPQDGASPEQIVQGFIDAGSGPEDNWATARLYLAPGFRDKWDPRASVTVDDRSLRRYASPETAHVTMDVSPTAAVDATGAYTPSGGGQTPLPFTLVKVDKQWRIAKAPQGVVLGDDQFGSVYRQYALMYYDPTWTYLVPDVRWFPATNAVTQISKELIDGKPSAWLSGAVSSAFPDNVSMDVPSVAVDSGIARVPLSGGALTAQQTTLDRMQTQLQASLATAGVNAVSMTSAGTTLAAHTLSTASTRIPPQSFVEAGRQVGLLRSDGSGVDPITGLSDAIARAAPTAMQLSADHTAAAVRDAHGDVQRISAKGQPLMLDRRSGLIAPQIDTRGYVWSVPAGSPSDVSAYSPVGRPISVAGAWPEASRITAMALSRDGTRLAALVTAGGQFQLDIAAVVRASDGAPQSLGQPAVLATLPGAGIDLTWLDDTTVGVLAHSSDGIGVIAQTVGGPGSETAGPAGTTTIAGSTGTVVRVRTSDGAMYNQRGSNWELAADGIRVLGTVQGIPR
ncbi:MAG TPA: LpqB family beta-propeller domain-containing protein [Microbacterium sp.]|nr:LpqB family beta-propeller domain-containing protein [Microbacterium sp.]HKT56916.1 LpqB family beta-propeller domain-containing protein [Microbacterium sp.]